jgi:hypothetical protein
MIGWHHSRIYARLQSFGLVLFTLGMASRNIDRPVIGVAALAVLLLYRLKVELAIAGHEEYRKLEAKLQRIEQINRWTMIPITVGLVGFIREAAMG